MVNVRGSDDTVDAGGRITCVGFSESAVCVAEVARECRVFGEMPFRLAAIISFALAVQAEVTVFLVFTFVNAVCCITISVLFLFLFITYRFCGMCFCFNL